MSRLSTEVRVPSYVLREGNHPIGPAVVKHDSGLAPAVTYCFSSKRTYDVFSASSQLVLAPYPLVKRFLQNQIKESLGGLQLLAIDASGPIAPSFHAATMESVLDAMLKDMTHVNTEYLFSFAAERSAYRLASTPSGAAVSDEQTEPVPLI